MSRSANKRSSSKTPTVIQRQFAFPAALVEPASFSIETELRKVKGKQTWDGSNGGNLGFEEKLWLVADKLRGHIDAAEYKHVVLGLVFLKYLSDVFTEQYFRFKAKMNDPEDKFLYTAHNQIWLPEHARWYCLQAAANNKNIGEVVDRAMEAIEEENDVLKNTLPKNYSQPSLNPGLLGEAICIIGTIGLGDAESRTQDILGRVYEYFLGRFASLEGKGGEFYTPKSVVKLLVEMIEPFKGKVYDPCCGSGGMFVQSESFVEAHGGNDEDILIYGQESNPATWRLCKMNLAIRGIKGDIGLIHGDTFRNDLHQGLEADFILANPPFNMTDWGGDKLRGDRRWVYGVPPSNNANYAWLQHIVSHLAPDGMAGLVLSNGSLSTNQDRDEGHIRRAMVEADVVDCIVALPPNMFYTTQIPACLWFLAKNKSDSRYRDRCGETLFIYAHNFGRMVDRTHRELTDDEVSLIAKTYNTWRSQNSFSLYKDIPGFCKSATLAEVKEHKYALVPGRYVGFDNTSTEQWDISRLRSEIAQVESRFVQINKTSQAALSLLQELLDGESFLKQP